MFPASTAYSLGTLGGAILATTVLHRLIDGTAAAAAAAAARGPGMGHAMSRHSLSLYVLHHAVHIWPLWTSGSAGRRRPDAFWQVAMPASAAAMRGAFMWPPWPWPAGWSGPACFPPSRRLRWLCDA